MLTAFVRLALGMFSGHLLARSVWKFCGTFMSPEPSDSAFCNMVGEGRERDARSETSLWVTSYGYCDTSPETNLFIATEGRYSLSSRCG